MHMRMLLTIEQESIDTSIMSSMTHASDLFVTAKNIPTSKTASLLLYPFSALCRNVALVLVSSADDQARSVCAGFTTVTCCIVTFCRAGCTWHARVFLSRGNCKAPFMHKGANWSYTRALFNTPAPVHCVLPSPSQTSPSQCT
jgi:hypothetical protein